MNPKVSSFIYHQLKNASTYRYHKIHKYTAEKILKGLEKVKGKTNKNLIKLSDEYVKEVLGWEGFAPWLHVYCAVNNRFIEGWIPDNYFAKVVLPAIDGGYGKISDLKPLSKHLFRSEVFPDIAYFVNGLFLSGDYSIINENELTELLFNNRDIIVFKIDNSMQGRGVFLFDRSSFDLKRIKILGNGVFQFFIEQHPFFSELMPTSVATIRITTYFKQNGVISVRACFLRIGRSEEQSIRWSSNLMIPVDLKTGELNSQGYFLSLLATDSHPDTHVVFAKRTIPFFSKCVSTALALHKQMPYDRCIGWDMIVDKCNNVKVMEWNGYHTDIKVHEAIQGPCFSDLGWENLWKRSI